MPTLPRRSAAVLALAALLIGAALLLALAVAFPMSDQAPIGLGKVMIGVALAMAAGTLALGDRLPRGALLAQAVVAAILNSVLVAHAHTGAGVMGDAIAYVWLTVYVAIFFPRATWAFSALVAVAFGAAIVAGGLPGLTTGWALVAATTAILGAVLSRGSRLVRAHVETDPLTGALNRGGLEAAGARAIERARRGAEQLSVAVVDLDEFKLVNDREGHAAGDRLLAEAAGAWRAVLRGDDVLARTGGDEFVVLMPGTSASGARAMLERLRSAHPVAWSAGVATWRRGEPLERCVDRADRRLYEAKGRRALPRAA